MFTGGYADFSKVILFETAILLLCCSSDWEKILLTNCEAKKVSSEKSEAEQWVMEDDAVGDLLLLTSLDWLKMGIFACVMLE